MQLELPVAAAPTAPTAAAEQPMLSARARTAWRAVQAVVWLVGAAMVIALLVAPPLGLHAFWNVLIPVAPALLAIAPGLWRNICPMATTALAARHTGRSHEGRLDYDAQSRLHVAGLLLLAAFVPLRHVALDTSGPATAAVLCGLAAASLWMGRRYDWKSGWCSGLCPVHPVERLYGSRPALTPPNAHCTACVQCAAPCPDSTPAMAPLTGAKGLRGLAAALFVGAFPGFVWGWFQVPDALFGAGWAHALQAYGDPLFAGAATALLFVALRAWLPRAKRPGLERAFAAAAIAAYYWYRLPMLFGFGLFPGDGMLIDATAVLPAWFPVAAQAATTTFFAWWFLLRRSPSRAWSERPAYASGG
ncbi:MAG: ferredoxin [Planctomycetota bacterium]|jgi:hypothetical protein